MSDLLQILIDEDFGYEHEGRVWGRSTEHSSLVVKEDEQLWFWNSRGLKGNVKDYLIKIRGMKPRDAERFVNERSKITVLGNFSRAESYTPYDKLIDLLWTNGRHNRKYWYDRQLTDETIDKNRLGFFNDWYTIPLYKNGYFLNFQCRRDEPKKSIKLWYDNVGFKPVLYNAEVLNFVSEIFITEGIVDAILLNQLGIPSISKSSGAYHWDDGWYQNFNNIKLIYYMADNDTAGENAARKIAKSLGTERVKVFRFVGKPEHYDTGDFFRDGGTKEDFLKMVKEESQFIFETEKTYGLKRHFKKVFGSSARW